MSEVDRINELVGNKNFTEAEILIDQELETSGDDIELIKLVKKLLKI